jgi:MFS family permease
VECKYRPTSYDKLPAKADVGSVRYVGYGSSVIGSIVANKGFIEHFATVTDSATGERVLDANHIGIWGAVSFASQIVIQFISPITADRWGRKFNLHALTVFFTLVGAGVFASHISICTLLTLLLGCD